MVELGERVDVQLPVGVHVGAVLVDLGHRAEGVAVEAGGERAEIVAQWLRRRLVEVDEDEAFPHVEVDRHEAVVGLVEVEELALLLHERAGAVGPVSPAVVLARELAADTLRLLVGVVLPDELVAPMPAHVVERPDLTVEAAGDDQRRAGDVEVLREVAAGLGELLDPTDVEPRPLEDRPPLEFVVLRRDRVLVGDRARCPTGGSAASRTPPMACRTSARRSLTRLDPQWPGRSKSTKTGLVD